MPARPKATSSLAKLERELDRANGYGEWLALATEHDRRSGADDWRASDDSDLLHVPEIRRSIATLRNMREAGETWPLTKKLQELLFRHQGEFTHAELYHRAKSGTKHVVTDFFDEIEACVHYLIALEVDGVGDDYKLEQLKRVGRVYGRPALLLSGGALLGLYHFGVIKTLFEQDLLPRTISGSSMGSIMAAWTCCHTDDELRTLFADLSLINTDALSRLPMREVLRQRTVMDQPKLLKFLGTVLPDISFDESLTLSRRVLNVTVSPVRMQQTPRLLNYLSSPEALVRHAVLASCAVPMVFKPVQLMARQRGVVKPWMENEFWVDGSVSGDLPFNQITQMFNINHFITSQANPHVVPFLTLEAAGKGLLPAIARMQGNIVRKGSAEVFDVARRHAPTGRLRSAFATAHAVSDQVYAGSDMHIQLPFRPALYAKVLSNPSLKEFQDYVRLGEQATWPQLAMIRDRTRLSRLFGTYIGILTQRMAARDAVAVAGGHQKPR
jgi:TAG lipase / steryl ester hydrolase / phospholipase A2 / LPA acyltransferase